MGALQPVIGAIMHNPLNILTQTPPADTYQNPTVITWWQSFLAVVDLALASLIVIGGYNVVVGRHLGLPHSELAEFLPRLLLAFGAAHFSLFFLGLFIDLENALNLVALNLAGTSMLTNIVSALFQGNLATEGLLVWVLMFVLGVMAILLGAQMAIRLALLWVLLVLSGPGLACFALPQTMGYGRMWLSLTATTVMVQFFQVVTLALGGMLVTSLGASNIFGIGGTLATLLVCVALLYLVLRIPGIQNLDHPAWHSRQSCLWWTHQLSRLLLHLVQDSWEHLSTRYANFPAGGDPLRTAGVSRLLCLGERHLPVREFRPWGVLPGLSHAAHCQCVRLMGGVCDAAWLEGDSLGICSS
jgi:hypothetical protein